ncbi:F-box only protein 22 [Anthophora retusa]
MENISQKRIHEDNDKAASVEEKSIIRTDRYLTYDVLRIIFKYLNGVELSNASMVCRSWLEVANDEKRTARGSILYFLQDMRSAEYFNTQIVQKLLIKPTLGLFFATPWRISGEKDCHCKVLPANCDVITMRTHGVIINDRELKNGLRDVVCTFLPDIPNVTIKTITFVGAVRSQTVAQYLQQMKTVFNTSESNSHKCLLLFCNGKGRALAKAVTAVLKQNNKKPSVWGGVVRDLLICNSKDATHNRCAQYATCIGVTLVGLVDSWSVVIDGCYRTKKAVEERLKSFRNHVSLRKHSMGFMFACHERGERMFCEDNVESSIFKNLFPEVPLVGCFGDGEFGNTTPNEEEEIWYNEISTVFLIVTYG